MTPQAWIAAAVGCAAIVDDLVRRRISNWITVTALVSGVALQSLQHGWHGSLSAMAGACAGGAAFLIFYLMGGLGGGDIKLVAGFGAVLGPSGVLAAALWTAACGGVIAAGVICISALRHKSSHSQIDSIPYAPAIALGAWLSLASKAAGIIG